MRQSADQDSGLPPFRVIHIGPLLSNEAGGNSVNVGIRLLNISPAHQLDVYLGLAWLARTCQGEQADATKQVKSTEATPLVAVIVCVDELSIAEYEFFELASRGSDLHGIYAYSCYGDTSRVQQAIAHGATGELTDEVWKALRIALDEPLNSTQADETITATLEHTEPKVTAPALLDEAKEAVATEENRLHDVASVKEYETSTESIDEIVGDALIEDDEDDLIGPVQVPWDRRPAPPQRAAPAQTSELQQPTTTPSRSSEVVNTDRAKDNGDREKSSAMNKSKRQPLLTPEEMRALIGDIENNAPLDDHPQSDDESV